MSCGPEADEEPYVFRIPAHGGYYSTHGRTRVNLVFVRLAYGRRFVELDLGEGDAGMVVYADVDEIPASAASLVRTTGEKSWVAEPGQVDRT